MSSIDRRAFVKHAVAGAAAFTAAPALAEAVEAAPGQEPAAAAGVPAEEILTEGRSGSDYMVDVLKALDMEYVAAVTGSSFRGLQESVINYAGNKQPEWLTCCHEEASVAMAHGYFKIEGKPIGVMVHGNVGLQHASMAMYNAYVDRVPIYILVGNSGDAATRQPGAEWNHSMLDCGALVRDYTKWDDAPQSLVHFGESAVRAYRIAMTPPYGPVLLVADSELQERPVPTEGAPLKVPKFSMPSPPQGDSGAVAEAARMLVAATSPVLVADKMARTGAGMAHLIELAELLQAPVVNQNGRMNFPSYHPLNHSLRGAAAMAEADVIVALEVYNLWGILNSFRDQVERSTRRKLKADTKLISITAGDLFIKANNQDFQRYPEVDLSIAGDAEATLPALIEAVKRLLTDDRRRAFQARGARLATLFEAAQARNRIDASYAWDASPVSLARLAAEVWQQVKHEDWSLVGSSTAISGWCTRIFRSDKSYHFSGGAGAGGIGYSAPASVGGALANRKHGRFSVTIQADGDLMFGPGVLWTAAHHRIPLLSVMHNNRAYNAEVMHLQRMANRRNRGVENATIGTTLLDPAIDYAKMAQSMGLYAEGPITDPKDLAPAIKRAIAVVKKGEPALLDVVTNPA